MGEKQCSNPLKTAQCWQRLSIKEAKWWGKVREQVREKMRNVVQRFHREMDGAKRWNAKKRCTLWPVLRRQWVVDHLCLQEHGYFLNIEPFQILHAASGRSSPAFFLHDGRPSASSEDGIGQRHCSLLWVYPNLAQSILFNWTDLLASSIFSWEVMNFLSFSCMLLDYPVTQRQFW